MAVRLAIPLLVLALLIAAPACGGDGDSLRGSRRARSGETSSPGDDATGSPGDTTGSSDSTGSTDSSGADACVAALNELRASVGAPPLRRWTDGEVCATEQAKRDAASGRGHGAFLDGLTCEARAQTECPDWPGPPASMIGSCLEAMWSEGPGGGHHDTIADPRYVEVACGFSGESGSLWAVQNFR